MKIMKYNTNWTVTVSYDIRKSSKQGKFDKWDHDIHTHVHTLSICKCKHLYIISKFSYSWLIPNFCINI